MQVKTIRRTREEIPHGSRLRTTLPASGALRVPEDRVMQSPLHSQILGFPRFTHHK
jgi:hypothetical protein